MHQPILAVGIVSAAKIPVAFNGLFRIRKNGKELTNQYKITLNDGLIKLGTNIDHEIIVDPITSDAFFTLNEVVIGISFHWERKEVQSFRGSLKLIIEDEKITVINLVPVEEYLKSVISSEMSATASMELLKAHAVISRSWLLSQLAKKNNLSVHSLDYVADLRTDNEWVKWWDREDHKLYDVCADDHCQRYQGITRATTPKVKEAVEATTGELLMYENTICDARFSKCCGGVVETFGNCWEPVNHPYLQKVFDRSTDTISTTPDLSAEAQAQMWIRTMPYAFCNTTDKDILAQVLNNYDQETTDFYRWKVIYTQKELSELIALRTGIDFGDILDLQPVQRGVSGRLVRLKIIGVKQTLIIGKELFIRKSLSESHLYSSAFVVDKTLDSNGIPLQYTITGAGWGHGVGLCQIGAAVMGAKGYSYREIVLHYYRNVTISKQY